MVTSGKVNSAEAQRPPMACAIRMTTAQMANRRIHPVFGSDGQRLKAGFWLNSVAGGRPVSVPRIEVNQDIAWLRPFAGTNDAALLELIHDSCSAGIPESEPALHQGDTCFLFAAN